MNDKLSSMSNNEVWDLIESLVGCKVVGWKRVFKTKCDSDNLIEKYKIRLVVKSYNQIKWIDYKRPSHMWIWIWNFTIWMWR